jgi:acetolactate synthase-1/2/3 large subunit
MTDKIEGHGGRLALDALKPFGVEELFTLSGGHIFPILDAAATGDSPLRLIDTRHEQTATFAAEGVAKLTRRPGVVALTAGPGVTNGISAITTAHFNGSPVVVLGGRAPQFRWGSGSLQEFDHVPVVSSITKEAVTVPSVEDVAATVSRLAEVALTPHRGPVFCDLPLDVVFASSTVERPAVEPDSIGGAEPDPEAIAEAARRVAAAERPALIAGSDLYWAGAWDELRAVAEELRVPVFANGLGRGCLPADHEVSFGRTRSLLKSDADLVIVVGTPLDFRLSFGQFGSADVIHLVDGPELRADHAAPAITVIGDIRRILAGIAKLGGGATRADHEPWIARLRDAERAAIAADRDVLDADSTPIKPGRIYGELRRRLDRDAVVIGDGGDFVSYAGKYVDSYRPGCWLDPGPYGCLGTGLGYAIAARLARPDAQVVAMLGDGAAGFSLMDVDTMVRHGLPAVFVVGNNGIWGLEKHPMRQLYGYDVAADLQPGCRYDEVVRALGGAGETVERPADIGPALDRALAAGVPYLVNVITDPDDVYPRSSNLA